MKIYSFLKIIKLNQLDLSQVEPVFDYSDLSEDAKYIGCIDDEEKKLFLTACFCSERVAIFEKIISNQKDYLYISKENLISEAVSWDFLKSLCLQMLSWFIRERLEIDYNYIISIRSDFLLYIWPLPKEGHTQKNEDSCPECPFFLRDLIISLN